MVYSVCVPLCYVCACVYLCVCMCVRHVYMCVTVFISCRMSLDLVETLLNIAETGNFDEVLQLFGAPLKQCPEILFFGLLQAKVSSTTIGSVWHTHTVYIICVSSPMDQQCRRSYCQDWCPSLLQIIRSLPTYWLMHGVVMWAMHTHTRTHTHTYAHMHAYMHTRYGFSKSLVTYCSDMSYVSYIGLVIDSYSWAVQCTCVHYVNCNSTWRLSNWWWRPLLTGTRSQTHRLSRARSSPRL